MSWASPLLAQSQRRAEAPPHYCPASSYGTQSYGVGSFNGFKRNVAISVNPLPCVVVRA